jgi:hypothetical protein
MVEGSQLETGGLVSTRYPVSPLVDNQQIVSYGWILITGDDM